MTKAEKIINESYKNSTPIFIVDGTEKLELSILELSELDTFYKKNGKTFEQCASFEIKNSEILIKL